MTEWGGPSGLKRVGKGSGTPWAQGRVSSPMNPMLSSNYHVLPSPGATQGTHRMNRRESSHSGGAEGRYHPRGL